MKINWYPGHIEKAFRMIEAELKMIDFVFYVLDARAVKSSFNYKLSKVLENKPTVYILNKSDLADEEKTKAHLAKFKQQNKVAVAFVGAQSNGGKQLTKLAENACSEVLEKWRAKGINKTLRGMVVGVPNSGKSTIINCLAKKAKTVVGDKAGVTKGKQCVKISEHLELLDTPGTTVPNIEEESIGENLALIGSLNDQIVDTRELAYLLIERMLTLAPDTFKERYKLNDIAKTPSKLLKEVATSRGYLLKGSELDLVRTAGMLVIEFRAGKLGKISLD